MGRWLGALLALALLAGVRAAEQMQSRAADTGVDLRVAEAQPVGTVVGRIPTKPGFTYRFNEPPKEFVLDPVTGEIKTSVVLDRESVDRYAFVVLSSQPTYPIEVRLRVTDVNDNYPEFPEPSIAVAFSESAAPGTKLLLDAATDKDLGENGITNDYRIVDGDDEGKFRLNVTVNPSGQTSYLHLETTGKLDRETNDFYILNISARDGGSPPKYGFLQVNVSILDVNDNPPIFDQSDFSVSLNESVPPGTMVLKVTATDSDLGDNSKITYEVTDTEKQFAVDPESGVITTTKKLNCPKYCGNATCNMTCVLTVIAKDHGVPRQDARTYVTVNLIDANDHDPVITFTYVPPTANVATVDENAKNGSLVAAITVTDLDAGLNGITSVSIIAGNELNHFRLENSSSVYIVHVNGILDREEISKYNLTVVATDRGVPSRTSTAFLVIHVNDVNDHEPVFEKSEYSTVLSELAPIGTYVAGITATDEDTGVNAEIFYDFHDGNQQQWFIIDHVTGLVTTKSVLDREIQGTVELNVSARDGGPNPKWAYTRLKVTILDENDEAPSFPQSQINATIQENIKPIKEIMILTASDYDQGTNGSVSYYLSGTTEKKYPNTFSLDAITGQLSAVIELDREKIPAYEILVIAKDQGFPPQTSSATVFLKVLDVNDNDPVFYPQIYIESITEDLSVGSKILQVLAYDRDEGENAKLTYKIESGGDGYFDIDPLNGFLYVKSALDREEKDYYSLTIMASDQGTPARSSQVPLVIHILDENDNSPQFTNTTFVFKIRENEPPDTFVGKLTAIDKDIGRNAELTFSLSSSQNDFRIDSRNGFIRTTKSFDRESLEQTTGQNYITLTVTVSDNGRVRLSDSVRVTIYITDVNDNAPVFTQTPYSVEVSEGAAVGASIMRVYSTDADEGLNGDIYYKLIGGDDLDKFNLDEATGQLFIRKPLDRETLDHYRLTVMAHDSGQSIRLSSTTTITIDVLDENDNAPVFSQTRMNISVLETEPINKKLIQFHATDADLGVNNEIQYSITSGNRKDTFYIDSYSGELFLHKHLDYEELVSYVLNITATDNGSPSLSSSISFVVNVIDANDNAPVFTNTAIVRQIREGIPIHTPIVTVTAEDPDSGINGKVYYSITHQDPEDNKRHFAINNITGVIHTLLPIDRESIDTFRITVVAYDRAEPPSARLSAEKLVTVIVEDINDNAPVFVSMNAAVIPSNRLGRSAGRGIFIMNVLARDMDSGTNGLVTYKLIHGGNDMFDLHRSNGALTLRYPPAMPNARWNLVIKATDEAVLSEQKSTETYLTVIMGATALEGITWSNANSVSVAENEPAGTPVLNLTNNYKSMLEYYIVNVTGDNKQVDRLFDIDSSLGILSTAVPLDREAGIERYEVEVCAVSSGSPLQSTTTKESI
ncbi:cadherin-related tumor suppressor-like [Aricia agestis]|uniref:cadherin-related tumor suppressor-like n=1 Tax=Aricia agestis TaxID=91739 RepID=UPI001C20ABEB|nr:cadherin-related tumor suppressor-like [Aricia agestis]